MKIIGTTKDSFLVELTTNEMERLTGIRVCSPNRPDSTKRILHPGDEIKIEEAWEKLQLVKDVGSRVNRFAREMRQIADDAVALAHHLPEIIPSREDSE